MQMMGVVMVNMAHVGIPNRIASGDEVTSLLQPPAQLYVFTSCSQSIISVGLPSFTSALRIANYCVYVSVRV